MSISTSIVMAAYNGERYIAEQLESIRKQTRRPDEVLIFDDGSTDHTPEIVREFIKTNHLEDTWSYVINETNKGCIPNFVEGALSASGDVIFYSDQDDIWDEKKVELMASGFEQHPDMLACCCLRTYFNNDGKDVTSPFDFTRRVRVKTEGFQKVSLNEVVKYNQSAGLCLAFRKELITETGDFILKNGLTHDLPIGTVAAIHDGYYVLNQKLVKYRQHDNNLSSPNITVRDRLSDFDAQVVGREQRLRQMRAVLEAYGDGLSENDRSHLVNAITETEESVSNLRERNVLGLVGAMFSPNPMMNRWIALNNLMTGISSRPSE